MQKCERDALTHGHTDRHTLLMRKRLNCIVLYVSFSATWKQFTDEESITAYNLELISQGTATLSVQWRFTRGTGPKISFQLTDAAFTKHNHTFQCYGTK